MKDCLVTPDTSSAKNLLITPLRTTTGANTNGHGAEGIPFPLDC